MNSALICPSLSGGVEISDLSLRQWLRCDWPSCKSTTSYGTTRELQNHQTDVHIAEVLNAWPGSCSWPGCKSKIFFKTSKRLESHVYNIHVTPLLCTVAGCKHERPFEREADLQRHVESKHTGDLKYKCRFSQCHRRGFARKDKLKLHEKTFHDQFACPYNHCTEGGGTEQGLQRHCSVYHRESECGLGSCGQTSKSRFMSWRLIYHLQEDHKLSYEVASKAVYYPGPVAIKGKVTLADFADGIPEFQDCESCIKKLKEEAAGSDGNGK